MHRDIGWTPSRLPASYLPCSQRVLPAPELEDAKAATPRDLPIYGPAERNLNPLNALRVAFRSPSETKRVLDSHQCMSGLLREINLFAKIRRRTRRSSESAAPLARGAVFASQLLLNARTSMLKRMNVDQARFIATLAKAARAQRDEFLGNVPEDDLDGSTPGRGEHNPTAEMGFEALPPKDLQSEALREAIASLSPAARAELYSLMRMGQGHLATKTWHQGVVDAEALGDEAVMAEIAEDPDLHDHIVKALYEAKLASS